jgi:hypothetical protein
MDTQSFFSKGQDHLRYTPFIGKNVLFSTVFFFFGIGIGYIAWKLTIGQLISDKDHSRSI